MHQDIISLFLHSQRKNAVVTGDGISRRRRWRKRRGQEERKRCTVSILAIWGSSNPTPRRAAPRCCHATEPYLCGLSPAPLHSTPRAARTSYRICKRRGRRDTYSIDRSIDRKAVAVGGGRNLEDDFSAISLFHNTRRTANVVLLGLGCQSGSRPFYNDYKSQQKHKIVKLYRSQQNSY